MNELMFYTALHEIKDTRKCPLYITKCSLLWVISPLCFVFNSKYIWMKLVLVSASADLSVLFSIVLSTPIFKIIK